MLGNLGKEGNKNMAGDSVLILLGFCPALHVHLQCYCCNSLDLPDYGCLAGANDDIGPNDYDVN